MNCKDCGKDVPVSKTGKQYDRCYDCNTKRRQASQPAAPSMQEVCAKFKEAMDYLKTNYPQMSGEVGVQAATGINQQYWSNQRTPRR